ncbi:CAMK family protein kinase [Histoplasma capsulatum var. duboisii H88]|uniref:Serine/threonine-protein kinase ATG1 n=1 Tax=Ajellomyces capsulatus (strain H88) TaxID=544711 RepID=F0UIF7_AJEC8|nr:CAMK family protein kinase [Histoplasma capsulatum var. duboisii H88]
MQYVGLDIGFHVQSSTRYTLATLGRSGADITVDGPSISRIQCSFETHAESDVVMLYDRSNSQTTEVFGVGCVPFEPGRRRRVVVRSDVNCMLSMGGCESGGNSHAGSNYRQHTDGGTRSSPINQVPVHHEPQIRYKKLAPLGAGAYEYIRYQRLSEQFEIFMALKERNVDYLIQRRVFNEHEHCSNNLHHQMLSALDYLASYGIIHRDVKPANILYTTLGKIDYRYYLTDFGFCNSVDQARSGVGSLMYMAPELLQGNQFPQTPKADIWSLFVTLAWAVNADNYRSKNLFTAEEIVGAALDAARTERMHHLKDMADIEPDKPASSSQMLQRHYNGIGRTIPLEQVETTTSAKHTREDVIMGSTSPQLGWPPPGPTYPSHQTALTTGLGISTFNEGPQ